MRSVVAVARRIQAERIVGVGAAGVLEQIHEHLPDHRLVDAHGRQLGGAVDVDDLPVERRCGIVDRGVEQLVDGHERAPRLQDAGLDAREVEHVGDQPHEAVGLVLDAAEQRLALVLGHVLAQCRGAAVMAVSGVRRSCETDCSRAVRRRSVSCSACSSMRLVLQPRAPEREPEDAAERLQHAERLAGRLAAARVDREQAERDAAVADRQREAPSSPRSVRSSGCSCGESACSRRAEVSRSAPIRSSSSWSRTVTRSAAPRRPSPSVRSAERAAERRPQVVAADEVDRERLQQLHAARSPRAPRRSRSGSRRRSWRARARSARR